MMIVDKVVEVLRRDRRISFAYLFGSFVRNRDYTNDIDVAVYMRERIVVHVGCVGIPLAKAYLKSMLSPAILSILGLVFLTYP